MSELIKFLFEGLPVRGAIVRLDEGWKELLRRRGSEGAYPPAVRALTDDELARMARGVVHYVDNARRYAATLARVS